MHSPQPRPGSRVSAGRDAPATPGWLARPGDPGPAHEVAHRAGGGGRFERGAEVQGAASGHDLDGEHAREAVDRCRLLADSKSTTIDLRTERAVVYGDLALLTTAIRNLVDNAVNYSDPQARVVVTVRRVGAVAEVVVSDNGLGISPTAQSRVFERFFRLDPARSRATGGTGLGLSIVKHVCANHGGDVRLWSEPGQGSTFTISLPVLADDDPVLTQLDRKAPR